MLLRSSFAFAVVLASAGAVSAQSFTTRIETRPFYGSVTALEKGVRVIRPLPPERQVIINPNKTPLTLGYNDTRIYDNRTVYPDAPQANRRYSNSSPFYGRIYYGANGFVAPGFGGYGVYGKYGHRGTNGFGIAPAF